MYSFAQRTDTQVLDEPLYGPYLVHTGAEHPGRAQLLDALDLDVKSCLFSFVEQKYAAPILFVKNMAHHLEGINDQRFLSKLENIFLIRNPKEMLPTLAKQLPNPTLLDTAYERQFQLFSALRSSGNDPLVIDSKELLLNPAKVLAQVCERLDLLFEPVMLSWPAGGRPEDGPWAAYWYHNLHTSTEFQPYQSKTDSFPLFLNALLDECEPYYNHLYEYALKA